ncbi:hypothetical protein [Saccharothrix sp. 6-C]|uniref:hypothetical protein n=1 Tax=Saccharothrix sp. 6-C TaxID=2781735 RepID=UPI00191704BB|nr:hypothetical protein [Saccharothrix sp. 6-C]
MTSYLLVDETKVRRRGGAGVPGGERRLDADRARRGRPDRRDRGRAGDFVFSALVMAGIGVCAVVMVTGHRPGRIMTDAGREHGTTGSPMTRARRGSG